MRRFIQGSEHEYTYYSTALAERGVDPHRLALQIIHEQSDLHACGEFLTNQSRAYYDVGHLEISTCEVTNPIDMVRWEKAGEKIVDWARRKVEELYLADRLTILSLKNNTAPDGTSYGSHENYCVPRRLAFPERFVRDLVPHLITRVVYTGAGDILDGRYVLSPSAHLTGCLVSSDTMHNTGVLNTRDEPHGDPSRLRRLHVQVGDALMNEVAIALRHFTTTCVLLLMEQDGLGDLPRLTDPVRDMWKIVETTNPDNWSVGVRPSPVFDGRERVSPIDIQRYYLERSGELIEHDHEQNLLKVWGEVLDRMDGKDTRAVARRVEWVDRYLCIKEKVDEGRGEMGACKRYSETGKERGYYYEREGKGLVDRLITDEDIISAIRSPPEDTRARARALLCERFEGDIVRIDWSVVKVKNREGDITTIDLDDPLETDAR